MTFARTVVLAARGIRAGDNVQRIEGRIGDVAASFDFEPPCRVESLVSAAPTTDFFGGSMACFDLTIGGKTFRVRGDVDVYTVPS